MCQPEYITATATVVIAVSSVASLFVVWFINKRDKEFKQQTIDLYQAVIVATIVAQPEPGTSESYESRIERFNNYYKGNTEIFPKKHNK